MSWLDYAIFWLMIVAAVLLNVGVVAGLVLPRQPRIADPAKIRELETWLQDNPQDELIRQAEQKVTEDDLAHSLDAVRTAFLEKASRPPIVLPGPAALIIRGVPPGPGRTEITILGGSYTPRPAGQSGVTNNGPCADSGDCDCSDQQAHGLAAWRIRNGVPRDWGSE